MKAILFLLIFLLPIQWEPNFDTAKKTAKEQNKLILLNFSGADWCVPCILLRKDFLESEEFANFANDNLVLVNADFPRKKKNKGTAEQVKRNELLAEQYNTNGTFPLTLVLNADGKVLKSWQGKPEMSLESWIEELKATCKANK